MYNEIPTSFSMLSTHSPCPSHRGSFTEDVLNSGDISVTCEIAEVYDIAFRRHTF